MPPAGMFLSLLSALLTYLGSEPAVTVPQMYAYQYNQPVMIMAVPAEYLQQAQFQQGVPVRYSVLRSNCPSYLVFFSSVILCVYAPVQAPQPPEAPQAPMMYPAMYKPE